MTPWIGRSVLVSLLYAQMPSLPVEPPEEAFWGYRHALVTLVAVHEDGTPVRGFIQCAGEWFKHGAREDDDDPATREYVKQHPFRTDSRGAVVMNPGVVQQWIFCWSEDKGKRGSVTVQFSNLEPSRIVTIVLNNEEF